MPEQDKKKWKMYKKALSDTIIKVVSEEVEGGVLPNFQSEYTIPGDSRRYCDNQYGTWNMGSAMRGITSSSGSGNIRNVFDKDLTTKYIIHASDQNVSGYVGVYVSPPCNSYICPEFIDIKAENCKVIEVYGLEEGKVYTSDQSQLTFLGTIDNTTGDLVKRFRVNPSDTSVIPEKFYSRLFIFCDTLYKGTDATKVAIYHVDLAGTCYIKQKNPVPYTDIIPVFEASEYDIIGDGCRWSISISPNENKDVRGKVHDGNGSTYWGPTTKSTSEVRVTTNCIGIRVNPSEVFVKCAIHPTDKSIKTSYICVKGTNMLTGVTEDICEPIEIETLKDVELTIPLKTDNYFSNISVYSPATSYDRGVYFYTVQWTKGYYKVMW